MSATTDLGTGSAGGAPGSTGTPEAAALAIVPGRARSVRFPKSPKIIIGLVMLGFFLLLAIAGPWIAPYSPGASVSGFSLAIGFVVSGALLTEIVFSYPGVGWILLQAVNNRDYPLLQGIFLIITFAVLAANLVADFVYVLLDPRTRQEA